MRILRFIVDGQTIKQDPTCDFDGLFPGRNPEIYADFVFSPEWDGHIKVLAFWSIMDREYDPQIIEEDDTCVIPSEVLSSAAFKIQVIGQKGKHKMETKKFTVRQTGNRR